MFKVRKRLLVAAVALICALMLTVGSTFAWLTMDNTAQVSMEITVSTESDALTVSLERDGVYSTELDLTSLFSATVLDQVTYYNANEVATLTDNVATEGFYGLSDEREAPNINYVTDGLRDKYIAVTLYFRSNNAGVQNICLTNNTSVLPVGQSDSVIDNLNWRLYGNIDASIYYGNGFDTRLLRTVGSVKQATTRAAYSTRIGFKTDYQDASNQYIYEPNTVNPGSMRIWDPYGETGVAATDDANPSYYKSNFAKEISAKFYGTTVQYTTATQSDMVFATSQHEQGSGVPIMQTVYSGNGYYQSQTTLYIWLEGRDGDCFFGVLQDSLQISLEFSAFIC